MPCTDYFMISSKQNSNCCCCQLFFVSFYVLFFFHTCYFRLAPSSWEPFSIGSIEGDTAFLEKPWWRPVETFVPLRGVKGFFLPRSIPLQFIKQINHILVDTEQHVILKLWVPKTNEDILRSASTVKWINHVDVLWALSRGIDYIIKISLQKGVNKGDSH